MGQKTFECDWQSKCDFTASTLAYWTSKYPDDELTFYSSDIDGNPVHFNSGNPQSHLDIFIVVEHKGKELRYACELKERSYKYPSDYYGEEGKEGWMYNVEKDGFLKKSEKKGWIPLYVNLYPDKKIRVWNISKIDSYGEVDKKIKRIEIYDFSERVKQHRLTLMNNQGKTYARIKGHDE